MPSKKVIISTIIDYITVLIIVLPYFAIPKPSPHERKFSITDESISHPYKGKEQISTGLITILAVAIPVVVAFIIIAIYKGEAYEYNQFFLCLLTSIGITVDFVEFIKALFGRFRPDFLSRCQIDYTKVDAILSSQYNVAGLPVGENRLFDLSICSNPDKDILDEGRRSFPSGHASTTFAAFMILVFFMLGKFRAFDHKVYVWRLFVSTFPIFGAIYVVATRFQDNVHHWSDLLAGTIIGTLVATVVYHLYYPPVTSKISNKPYKYRIKLLMENRELINDGESTNQALDKELSKLV